MLEKQKFENILADHEPSQTLAKILAQMEEAIRDRKRNLAYELSLQATQVAPNDPYVWFLRASLAPSLEERVLSVNRLNELDPDFKDRHHVVFFTLQELFENDPYLAYLEESEELYRVLRSDRRVLSIPKKRSPASPPPHKRKDELKAAQRWFGFALIGLLFSGLLTLVFAPLAAWSAIQTSRSVRNHTVQVRSAVVVLLSSVLFVIGLFLSVLLVLHLAG